MSRGIDQRQFVDLLEQRATVDLACQLSQLLEGHRYDRAIAAVAAMLNTHIMTGKDRPSPACIEHLCAVVTRANQMRDDVVNHKQPRWGLS